MYSIPQMPCIISLSLKDSYLSMEHTLGTSELTYNDLFSILKTVLITVGLAAIITIQFFRIREYKKLFAKMAEFFGFEAHQNMSKRELIDKIIKDKQTTTDISTYKIPSHIIQFIQSGLTDFKIFTHFTYNKATADRILNSGFKYADSFYKSTQEISANLIDLHYKLQLYRQYGNFLIVISIPVDLYHFTMAEARKHQQDAAIELGLSHQSQEEELEYTIPAEFVKGYVNFLDYTITGNNHFLQNYQFDEYKNRITDQLSKQ